jgi:hypothetical protein
LAAKETVMVVATAAAVKVVGMVPETVVSAATVATCPSKRHGLTLLQPLLPSFRRRHHHFRHFRLDAMVKVQEVGRSVLE